MTTLLDRIGVVLNTASVGVYSTSVVPAPDAVQIQLAGFGESPDTAVCISTYNGGPEPDSRNGWEYPRLQVKVRAINPLDALALDLAAFDALQFTPGGPVPRDIGGGWYLQDCYALQSEAEPLGQDAQGRWEYARNYQLSAERS